MPRYDRKCPSCGWIAIDLWEKVDDKRLCDDCGEPTERAWLTAASVIGDECDFVSHHGGKEPIRFRSKIEHRRWLKEHGYRIKDDHVGTNESDKSQFSQRAAIMDAQTLANATELVSRASKAVWRDPEKAPLGITSSEGMMRYLRDQNRIENRGEFGFGDRSASCRSRA